MKQKIVIEVHLCCEKCGSKAMQIAAVAEGVNSVALEGKDKLVVIGEGVDAATLTCSLRKKFNHASLLSVDEVKPKSVEKVVVKGPQTPPPAGCPPCCYPCHCDMCKVIIYEPNPTTCTLM
ncbi:hypothetical protein K2173_015517 [Erythroxylum novogranatense]|uniref:HMA domain-containing protein n=1 Tax=Erythroxylum novogranatense TaxID=1862640 RepID=A0AAV8SRX7_9ROSI|nr:hypothetical protein K2173_015517 [Erythroxylum novogranatense]